MVDQQTRMKAYEKKEKRDEWKEGNGQLELPEFSLNVS
jgi:hypothetical protein